MTLKNYFICIIICALGYCPAYAQELHRQTNLQPSFSVFQEALKIDLNKSPDVRFPIPGSHSAQRANNGWYPVKGEIYIDSETEIAGYTYFTIGQNGLLDKETWLLNKPGYYDSTVSVMNRTPYTKGKDLIDTVYNYLKKPDGAYKLDARRTHSYHYFDHFEADSFYYEYILHTWDDANKQWNELFRQKTAFNDTLIEFNNRISQHQFGSLDYYFEDYITYNQQGFVDSLYMIRNIGDGNMSPQFKIYFTNDEQGCYTQRDYFKKEGTAWVKSDIHSNITWTEWNGFTYSSHKFIGIELVSPYKRSKIKSYDIASPIHGNLFYQKWWDINGTKTNIDTIYWVIGERLYPMEEIRHIYNEYGDYVEFRQTDFFKPDENGKQEIVFYNALFYKYTYDAIYGMTEYKYYHAFLEDGKIDTIFLSCFRYTEFAPVSITEPPQSFEPTLRLVPNPVSGMVTISTTVEMQQLNIFDITGRLVGSQSPAGNQVVFDTGVLPKGVYLVQALLKDGGQRTGKLIKI
jgi:hypothetical protein